MKIAQAHVETQATHDYATAVEVSYTLRESFRTVFERVSDVVPGENPAQDDERKRLMFLLESLIARLLDLIAGVTGQDEGAAWRELGLGSARSSGVGPRISGSGVEIETRTEVVERYRERECSTFSTCGSIATADGRSLSFELGVAMSREFAGERQSTQVTKTVLRDPLVINFDGQAATLSGRQFEFDLDMDGKRESLAGLSRASGFLAIDRDADGQVKDGSELFGTRSGDGFDDLAKLDADGNRWIDENDPEYDRLRIWRPGTCEPLQTLRESGVGAIYVAATPTPFALTDAANGVKAYVQASSVFLTESGGCGTVQHVDLATG